MDHINVEILTGHKGILELVARNDIDLILNALVSYSGIGPTLKAIENGIDVALANKESLVTGGKIIKESMEKTGAKLILGK